MHSVKTCCRRRSLLAVWLASLGGTACASALEDAASAHERGDDATAVRILRPLAEEGNVLARFRPGYG